MFDQYDLDGITILVVRKCMSIADTDQRLLLCFILLKNFDQIQQGNDHEVWESVFSHAREANSGKSRLISWQQ